MLTVEQLKDQIRLTFSEHLGDVYAKADRRSGEDRRKPRRLHDSWPMAKRRLWFVLEELGHAWVNVFKELLADKLRMSERLADTLKYPLSLAGLIGVVVVWELAAGLVFSMARGLVDLL